MAIFNDVTPRYAPDRVVVLDRVRDRAYTAPVDRAIFHPIGAHPDKCPIRSDVGVLQLVTAHGSRWYGCDRAYINSELRMIVIGCDSRDEVRAKWTIVPEGDRS